MLGRACTISGIMLLNSICLHGDKNKDIIQFIKSETNPFKNKIETPFGPLLT